MPHVPNFPDDESEDDGRNRGGIIERIIGDGNWPTPTPTPTPTGE